MAKLMRKDLKEKDSSRAMRGWLQAWERLHSIQAHAHLQPRRKINYCLLTPSRKEYLDLYHRPQDFSPAPYSQSLQCHASISPSSSKLDRCDSFQHLTTQFLKPYLTSGTNMHWHLGQIHLPYYFFKIIENPLLKSSLIKGKWNQPAKGNSLKLGVQFQYTNVMLAETAAQLPFETSDHPAQNSSHISHCYRVEQAQRDHLVAPSLCKCCHW